jgi:opacity protein-like surface antigen
MDSDGRHGYAWSDDMMRSGIGVSAIIGGGVVGFTDRTMRDTTANVGGLWDFRLTLGSHIPLGVELAYLGSATNLNGLPSQNGTLIGTTFEGALRYNVLPHFIWTPYVFAGVGWQRYDVSNANVTLSDSGMNDRDNLLEVPLGAGLAYRVAGFVLDLRGTFRAATDQNLVLKTPVVSPTSSDFAPMHTWEASAALGYEF